MVARAKNTALYGEFLSKFTLVYGFFHEWKLLFMQEIRSKKF